MREIKLLSIIGDCLELLGTVIYFIRIGEDLKDHLPMLEKRLKEFDRRLNPSAVDGVIDETEELNNDPN